MSDIREEFEKWIHSRKTIMLPLTLDKEGWYYSTSTDNAYQAYQAATLAQQKKVEALEIQVQELKACLALSMGVLTGESMSKNSLIKALEIGKQALSNTPNPAEWVWKDSLEVAGWQFYQDGEWFTGSNKNNHKENTIEAGFKVAELYRIKGE